MNKNNKKNNNMNTYMELTELFTKFFVKYDVNEIKETTVSGWNHQRPAIGFFNSNGAEVANICDECLYQMDDCMNAIDENGNFISIDEDDEDYINAKDVSETHLPVFHASVDNVCSLYCHESPDRDVEAIAEEINEQIINDQMCVDVFFKKNGKPIESDVYEDFNRDCYKMFRPILEEALKLKKLLHIKKAGAAWPEYSENYTWTEFKVAYDLPMSWTKAAFMRKVKSAEIKTLYFYDK